MHHMKGPPGAAIICLEGASAAGKTTLSHAIAARTGAPVIAEV
jgi:uridine kinase